MKKIIGLMLFLLSMSSYSSDYAPITEDIIACHGSTNSDDKKSDLVMVRQNRPIGNFTYWRMAQDMIVSYHGEKRLRGGSQGLSQFNIEGTHELPDNGENWTYDAPEGTFFTAIGNLKGFFVYRAENGEVKGLYYRVLEGTIDLNCTTDPSVADTWIELVNKYKLY